jgi:SAM-dependent methyltransferase
LGDARRPHHLRGSQAYGGLTRASGYNGTTRDYYDHMKQYYDRLAYEYEENAASREEPSEDLPGLLHAISLLPPASVLDVACGTGFFTQHLGSEVTGLDQSEAMLEVARRHVPWAEFVRGDAFRMPFADHSFERVFASFFYGLLPLEDRGRFLDEARRVGDELILVEPTPEWTPSGRAEGWKERRLSDGSRYEIYRRHCTAETFTEQSSPQCVGRMAVPSVTERYWPDGGS